MYRTSAAALVVFAALVVTVLVAILVTVSSVPKIDRVASRPAVTHPIDVVYTWVDGSDPEWKRIKRRYEDEDTSPDMLGTSVRFNTHAQSPDLELRTSIESVLRHMPWVQTIHVVTMRPQIPPCLAQGGRLRALVISRRVRIVHHDQMWGADLACLPVFNSRAIESNLHRIPGLSEHFLYFNDDMMVARPCTPEMFFCDDGGRSRPIQRGSWVPGRFMEMFHVNHCQTMAHQSRMLNAHAYFQPAHVAIALTKSILVECEAAFPAEFARARCKRFRGKNQVVAHFLAANHALRNRTAVLLRRDPVRVYVMNYSIQLFSRIAGVIGDAHLVCINDVPTEHQKRVIRALRRAIHLD